MIIPILILSLISPFFGIIAAIWQYHRTRNSISIALEIAVALAVIAINYDFGTLGDLARYIVSINAYRGIAFLHFDGLPYGNLPGTAVLFWLLANYFGVEHVITITAFISFFLTGYVVYDYARTQEYSIKRILFCTLILISCMPVFSVVNSVRSSIAISMVVFAAYIDLYKDCNKVIAVIAYIVPILFHPIGAIGLLLRILVAILGYDFNILGFIISIAGIPLALAFFQYFSITIPIINVNISEMLTEYSEWRTTGWAAEVATSRYQTVMRGANALLMIALLIKYLFSDRIESAVDHKRSVSSFCLYSLALTIGFSLFITVPAYRRLAQGFEVISGAIYIGNNIIREDQQLSMNYDSLLNAIIVLDCCALIALNLFQVNAVSGIESFVVGFFTGIVPLIG